MEVPDNVFGGDEFQIFVGAVDEDGAVEDEASAETEVAEEDRGAERIAIEIYAEMIRYVGGKDATTRRLLESILEQEEEHADDLEVPALHGDPKRGNARKG